MFEPEEHRFVDEASGLTAFIVIDDTSLGPAAGGIRTARYGSEAAALEEARALARAMTYKCALAGIPAGGGKGVVLANGAMDRRRAFERLGECIEGLGGRFLTAGDLGTTEEDLAALARRTRYVYTDVAGLGEAVGRGCMRAMEACVTMHEPTASGLEGLRVAVQGCGMVGEAVARQAARRGAKVLVADLDAERAERVAAAVSGVVVDPEDILTADVDIVSPCAIGGALRVDAAFALPAWAVCGAANNILETPEVEDILVQRGVLWVPDVISSGGAVIEGIGKMILGLERCDALVDRIGETTLRVLETARDEGRRPGEVARELARERIERARRGG